MKSGGRPFNFSFKKRFKKSRKSFSERKFFLFILKGFTGEKKFSKAKEDLKI
ncbi:hypothetical protein TDIS_1492 [Thermosulfurimonas dismutans]|uniref:Uncharacterized protein n=1 Tax=Thermosulfurimonas dismutans TaxID=999894 RepID=A0A179D4A0_9BACT|nr:hypothetical protein TDIS_1492 [Thermosulfurimonas dismutans]